MMVRRSTWNSELRDHRNWENYRGANELPQATGFRVFPPGIEVENHPARAAVPLLDVYS